LPKTLIIDDMDAHRDLASRVLKRAGYDVVEAAGGVDGIAAAGTDAPDLILLDLAMPDMDGFTVAK
jgi:two-component system OmpR family response regulator